VATVVAIISARLILSFAANDDVGLRIARIWVAPGLLT
jgi:hypothetical protein